MEKEKTRGRTRRKQPSRIAGFLYHEGRRWCAAALSLCLILNNMASVTWAAETAGKEDDILFKLTSSSLYEALQEAVREGNVVDEKLLFQGQEKDVEAYEKLFSLEDGVCLDDGLYELKPEFEDEDKEKNQEDKKEKELQLRIFASIGWEIDPDKEYEVVGDEKIIFYLSNASDTEKSAVIQVDEQKTENIVVVPKSAVVIEGESEEEGAEKGTAEDGEVNEETKTEAEENDEVGSEAEDAGLGDEGGKTPGHSGGSGGSGGSGNGSGSSSGASTGNSAGTSDADLEDKADSAESDEADAGKADADKEEADAENGNDHISKDENAENKNAENENKKPESQGKPDSANQGTTGNQGEESSSKEDNTDHVKPESSEKKDEEKPESGSTDKESARPESSEKNDKESSAPEKTESSDKSNTEKSESSSTERPGKTDSSPSSDKSDNSGSSDKSESSDKSDSSDKSGSSDKSESSDNSGKSDNSGSSDSSSEKRTEVSAAISRKRIRLVTDNLEEGMTTDNEENAETIIEEELAEAEEENAADTDNEEAADAENTAEAEDEAGAGEEETIGAGTDEAEANKEEDSANPEDTTNVEDRTRTENAADAEEITKAEDAADAEEITKAEDAADVESSEAEGTSPDETEETEVETESKEAVKEEKTETASASDAEDKEIEGELYEAVVMDEKSVVVFVTTAEELGLNNAALSKASDSNAERVTPAFEKEVELENVIVQVRADENVLPEGVQLQVKELKEEGEDAAQYEEAKEALDSKGTEYDGMMALDISFLDKKSREIEPDGNVQVSIKVKKEALPEEADLESITVQHLAEDEGEVFVEEVADSGNKTRGKVEVEAEAHVEVAFEVDSFSVFTVTWKDGEQQEDIVRFNLNFYSLNQNGEGEEITENIPNDKTIAISTEDFVKNEGEDTGSWTISIDDYFANAVQGYSYAYMKFTATPYRYQSGYVPEGVDANGIFLKGATEKGEVDDIKVKKTNSPFGFPYLIEINQKENELPIICPSGLYEQYADITLDIYYHKADIGILSTILEDGRLTANRELEPGQSYVWYKWSKETVGDTCPTIKNENGEDIRDPKYQVNRKIVTGSKWNIEQNGKVLNAVHDGGANHYYLVAIRDNESGKELMASHPFLIDYSDELKNGSFESPILNGKLYGFYENGTEGLVWKTTTQTVEIVNENNGGYHDQSHFLTGKVPDGKQCAELNARPEDGAGALYQDVLTAPGATLHWSLWHRARGSLGQYNLGADQVQDTMYVIIMPTQVVEATMEERNLDIDALKDDIIKNPQNYPDSTRVWTLTSPREWTFHTDDYVVGEEQYLTRFFFVAGPVASGLPTYGNLLDDIRFGTELPEINENVGGMSVTKLIHGLSEEEIRNYELTLRIKKIDGSDERNIVLKQFTSNNGSYVEAQSISDLSPGEYTIEEILPASSMTEPTVSIELVERNSDGTETKTALPVYPSSENHPQATINVEKGKLTSIQITNSYVQPSDNFVVSKVFRNGNGKEFKPGDVTFSEVEFGLYPADENWNILSENPVKHGKIQLDANNEGNDANKEDITGIVEFTSLGEGYYLLREDTPPTGYKQADDRMIFVGEISNTFGVYLYDGTDYLCVSENGVSVEIENVEHEELPDLPGAILPDTGGPGLAMFERYGWFLLMLALLMAGVEVRCYGERKYKRASLTQHEEFEDPL